MKRDIAQTYALADGQIRSDDIARVNQENVPNAEMVCWYKYTAQLLIPFIGLKKGHK